MILMIIAISKSCSFNFSFLFFVFVVNVVLLRKKMKRKFCSLEEVMALFITFRGLLYVPLVFVRAQSSNEAFLHSSNSCFYVKHVNNQKLLKNSFFGPIFLRPFSLLSSRHGVLQYCHIIQSPWCVTVLSYYPVAMACYSIVILSSRHGVLQYCHIIRSPWCVTVLSYYPVAMVCYSIVILSSRHGVLQYCHIIQSPWCVTVLSYFRCRKNMEKGPATFCDEREFKIYCDRTNKFPCENCCENPFYCFLLHSKYIKEFYVMLMFTSNM